MVAIESRTFCTVRLLQGPSVLKSYEQLANLITKYGCRVSKVSDGWSVDALYMWITVYFDIPKENLSAFLAEEKTK